MRGRHHLGEQFAEASHAVTGILRPDRNDLDLKFAPAVLLHCAVDKTKQAKAVEPP